MPHAHYLSRRLLTQDETGGAAVVGDEGDDVAALVSDLADIPGGIVRSAAAEDAQKAEQGAQKGADPRFYQAGYGKANLADG
jgi:hypothetical protein